MQVLNVSTLYLLHYHNSLHHQTAQGYQYVWSYEIKGSFEIGESGENGLDRFKILGAKKDPGQTYEMKGEEDGEVSIDAKQFTITKQHAMNA